MMSDNLICAGACGLSVGNKTTCKTCKKYLHPACASKHTCSSTNDLQSLQTMIQQLHQVVTTQSQTQNSMQQDMKQLHASVAALTQKVDAQTAVQLDTNRLIAEIRALRQENSDLRATVATLNDRIDAIEQRSPQSVGEEVLLDLYDEIENRRQREKNIIIYNVPELQSQLAKDCIAHDMAIIKSNLVKIIPNIIIHKIIRLGPKENNPRPLKVILNSKEDALQILKNKKDFNQVNIQSDRTPAERSHLKKLRDTMNERMAAGEQGLTIRYRRGRPEIVRASNSEKNM